MSSAVKFWDRIASRYSKKPVPDEAVYRKKLKLTREYFRPDTNVLEIGCGTGSTAIAHAPHVRHVRATDISEKMIEIARSKAKAAGVTNVRFETSSIDALELADESVDVVLALSILHLVEERDPVIERMFNALKPGGVLVSSTPCLGDNLKFFKYIGPVGKFLGLMPLVRIFTVKELEESLVNAGFGIDYKWQPGTGKSNAIFIIAKKAG